MLLSMIPHFRNGPYILMYHSIDDGSEDPYTVTINAFREQVSWLSGNGFESVPLSFVAQSIRNNDYRSLRRKVVFTFDDGYKDFVTNALPVLLHHGATATVFLVTDMIGGESSWSKNCKHMPLMSMDDLTYIKTKGISLGGHTATHANLPILEDKELHRQLSDSYNRLTALGESFYSFSYPWGQWTTETAKSVKETGYACAVMVRGAIYSGKMDIYHLPRVVMRDDMDFESFKAIFYQTPLTRFYKACSNKIKNARKRISPGPAIG